MAGGRPSGVKNKSHHKAGGDRRSKGYKRNVDDKQLKETSMWVKRLEANKSKKLNFCKQNVKHPLCEDNLLKSQQLLKCVLNHKSMPKSKFIPDHGTIVDDNEVTYDELNYESCDKKPYKYIPSEKSPLGLYLSYVKKMTLHGGSWSNKEMIVPTNSPLQSLGSFPNANLFYKNVIIYNFNPKKKCLDLFGHRYQCIYCASTNLKLIEKRYRPAFCGSKIHWILYDRFQCLNSNCTGGCEKNRCFGTIDSMFLEQLPKPISDNFKYIFPSRGPGIDIDMVKSLSIFTDKHVLFSAFANCVNDLQCQYYYEQSNAYYTVLDQWLEKWSHINKNENVTIFPIGSNGYNGDCFEPYSAFGEVGYHNGIKMTRQYARNIFLALEEKKRGSYVQNSFQAWHDDGMTVDDTHKITKFFFVNTSGRSRVRPFTAMMTVLNKTGKIVSARFKYTKNHEETESILKGIRRIRDLHNVGPLKHLSLDDPAGDMGPFNNIFPELKDGTIPYVESGTLPRLKLIPEKDYLFFTTYHSLHHYILSIAEDLSNSSKHYGLDTEFERDTAELTILSLSFSKLPVLVVSLYMMNNKLPAELVSILRSEEWIACGRLVGTDCNKLHAQLDLYVPTRIELRNIALFDKPELQHVKGATGLDHLTETYTGMKMPVEKSIGQNATYMTDNLSDELILYAAADAYCHRIVFDKKISSILMKQGNINPADYNCTVLKHGSQVLVNHRGKVVAKGVVIFNGIAGAQRKWGKETIGRNHVIVFVDEIKDGDHKPKPRHPSWDGKNQTLNDLWKSVDGGLKIVTKHKFLSVMTQEIGQQLHGGGNGIFDTETTQCDDNKFNDFVHHDVTYNNGDYSNLNNNNEPLEIDDYIEYYLPDAVYGNKESLRRAHVINISEPSLGGSLFWLELSSGDLLPEDTRIKRIKGKTGEVIIGTYREVQNYYMKDNNYMNNTKSSTNQSDNTQTRLKEFVNKTQEELKMAAKLFTPTPTRKTKNQEKHNTNSDYNTKRGLNEFVNQTPKKLKNEAIFTTNTQITKKRNEQKHSGINLPNTAVQDIDI